MGIERQFSWETKIAGKDWLKLFLKSNKSLSIRKAEGIKSPRLKKVEVDDYFELLKQVLTQHVSLNKPLNMFNIDESGLQLNNDPGSYCNERK